MKHVFIVAGIVLVLGCGVFMMITGDYVVTLTEAQLQERLDSFFPIEKDFLVVFAVTLSNPRINLYEGTNRLDFQVDAKTNVPVNGHPLQGTGKISGKIGYTPATGEFYVDDSRIERLDIGDVPEKYSGAMFVAANFAVRTFLDQRVLYTLKPSDVKQSVAKLVLQEVVVEQGKLKITLSMKK